MEPLDIYLNELRTLTIIKCRHREAELLRLVKKGLETDLEGPEKAEAEEAKKLIVESVLPLVVHWARKYRRPGVSLEDLICAGNVGVMMALVKYDPKFEVRFSTYAVWWIRNRLQTESAKACVVPIPPHVSKYLPGLNQLTESLQSKLGYPPSDREILCYLRQIYPNLTKHQARGIMQGQQVMSSHLNGLHGELATDRPSPLIEDGIDLETMVQYLLRVCTKRNAAIALTYLELDYFLPIRERWSAKRRRDKAIAAGLRRPRKIRKNARVKSPEELNSQVVEPRMTLETVALSYGITKERVRQIMNQTFEVLHSKFGETPDGSRISA